MNDSVYAVLGLTEDQVERVKAIDQQYAQERMKLNSSPDNLSRNELDRRMSGLVADREKEMRGVLNKEQFEAWVGKRPTAKPGQRK